MQDFFCFTLQLFEAGDMTLITQLIKHEGHVYQTLSQPQTSLPTLVKKDRKPGSNGFLIFICFGRSSLSAKAVKLPGCRLSVKVHCQFTVMSALLPLKCTSQHEIQVRRYYSMPQPMSFLCSGSATDGPFNGLIS